MTARSDRRNPVGSSSRRRRGSGEDSPPRRSTKGSRRSNHHHQEDRVARILQKMSVADLIGQLTQLDVRILLEPDPDSSSSESGQQKRRGFIMNETALHYYIGELGVGSILLNTGVDDIPWNASDYRAMLLRIQSVAQDSGRPPVLGGIDSVHGANYVHNAILTPQPLNLAATFNVTVTQQAGVLTSRDSRAAGMQWLFSPLLGLALQPRWSRVYETFGEDPFLVGVMATHMIQGIQTVDDTSGAIPSRAAACAKHFVGSSMPRTGHDRSPSWIPTRHLYQYFVPPWKKAVEAGALTVMRSYSETDGVPTVSNPSTLNYLLRQRLNFTGVLLTDHEEIRRWQSWHHNVAATVADDTVGALSQTSIDVSMIPWNVEDFRDGIMQGLHDKDLSEERIRQSARRILQLKEQLHMFDEIFTMDDPNLNLVGTDEARVLEMVHQSIILTKNEGGLLPLQSSSRPLNILVTGPTANSRIYQSGGWTYQWSGAPDESWFTYGSTVQDAMSKDKSRWNATYLCGTDILGQECEPQSLVRAVEAAKLSDVVIVCVGEESFAGKPGDIRSLRLPGGQYALVDALFTQADAKIVLVYFGGRPRLLGSMVEQADAVLIGFLPGPSAGDALADIISGRVNPSARLPITYPLADDGGGSPYFHPLSDQCTAVAGGDGTLPHNVTFAPCPVEWSFGHGLSYTSFQYSDLTATGGVNNKDLQVSVKVRNTGDVPGAETVLFFTFDKFRRTTLEYKRLRAFDKVSLQPGEEALVARTIPAEDLRFVGRNDDRHYVIDPQMTFWVGVGASTDCRRASDYSNGLCLYMGRNNLVNQNRSHQAPYLGACESACDIWVLQSGCASHVGLSMFSCMNLCTNVNNYPAGAADIIKEGWGWNYVNCLESVVVGLQRQDQLHDPRHCWKMTTLCRDIFQTENLDEYGVGPHRPEEGVNGQPAVSYALALLAGLLSAIIYAHALYGRTGKQHRPRVGDDDPVIVPYSRLEADEQEEPRE